MNYALFSPKINQIAVYFGYRQNFYEKKILASKRITEHQCIFTENDTL